MAILIRPLKRTDNRTSFRSGHTDLDLFFHRYAGQNQFRHHIGVTHIALQEQTICGYVTIAAGSMEFDQLPESSTLPHHYPLPILRLGRMAVDLRYQSQGIGKLLLQQVCSLALHQKETSGCIGIFVDAKPEVISFYQKYGFQLIGEIIEGELRGHPTPTPMFLPIKSISLDDSRNI